MANKLVLKKSSVASKVPLATDLVAGELAVNLADAKLYTKDASGNVILVGSGAAGAVSSVAGKTGAVTLVVGDVSGAAPLASPALTGTPTAPTAATSTNTTQVATTAFVNAEIANDAAPIAHVGSGGTAHSAATASVAGFMSAADKSKLNGIAANATANTGTVTSVAAGSYLTGGTITNSGTLAVDATSANTASKVVARDASGNFSAGTITATLSGNATSATTATNQSGGTVSATSVTTSGAITANGNANYSYQFAHGNWSRVVLPAGNNGAATGEAGLYQWISEPAATWTGAGIGRNRRNDSGSFSRVNTALTGQMIRFDEGTGIQFSSQDTAGTNYYPLSLSGNNATVAGTLTAASLGGTAATGSGASGTWGINISGNAATASNGGVTSVNGQTGAVTVGSGQYFGSAATKAIAYNANTISENVTVTAGNNGLSAGPITISTGYTVTVETGAAWVIV